MTKSGTGSRLRVAVAITLVVMTAFSSAAFAQQVQTTLPSWTGRFEWTHICEGGGNRDETRGISDLTLDYDRRGNLTGTLAGSIPERTLTGTCSSRLVAPGTFSAKLVGSYTSGQDTFSTQAVEVRTTPARASWTCPAGTSVADQAFFSVYEGPMFRDAFRDLRRQPDGSRKSSGESTFSAGGSTCTTKYSLTLRRDCPDPDLGLVSNTRDPFGPETPADIAPKCELCPGGTWQLKIPQVTFHPTERQEEADRWTITKGSVCVVFPPACEPKIIPQCVYTYESIWLCAATGEVTKRTKSKVTDGHCQPKG